MKFCRYCNIYLNTKDDKCPLCYKMVNERSEEVNHQPYPKYRLRVKQNNKLQLILAISTIIACLISVILNGLLYKVIPGYWCFTASLVFLISWMFARLVLFSHRNLSLKLITLHVVTAMTMFVADYTLSSDEFRYWSITYAMPFLAVVFLIVTLLIVTSRYDAYPDYFGNIIIHIILMFLPLSLYFGTTGLITSIIPGVVTAIIGVVTLIGIFVFPNKKTKQEIKKRLHI